MVKTMKIVKESIGSITIYPFLSETSPEQAERGAVWIGVYNPGEEYASVRLSDYISTGYTLEAAKLLAEALIKALELAGER